MANPTEPGFTSLTGYEVCRCVEAPGVSAVWLLKHVQRHEDWAVQHGPVRFERLDPIEAIHRFGYCVMQQVQEERRG